MCLGDRSNGARPGKAAPMKKKPAGAPLRLSRRGTTRYWGPGHSVKRVHLRGSTRRASPTAAMPMMISCQLAGCETLEAGAAMAGSIGCTRRGVSPDWSAAMAMTARLGRKIQAYMLRNSTMRTDD